MSPAYGDSKMYGITKDALMMDIIVLLFKYEGKFQRVATKMMECFIKLSLSTPTKFKENSLIQLVLIMLFRLFIEKKRRLNVASKYYKKKINCTMI